MSKPRKNTKFNAFAITITKSPGDHVGINMKKFIEFQAKFGEAYLLTQELHESGENHWHIYQETKKDYTTSDFKKKYWRAIIEGKKWEDRSGSNMYGTPCNGFQGWIMYILKDYEPLVNDNILLTSLSKEYILKIHNRQKEFVESRKYRTVSRANYLLAFSKRVRSLNKAELNMQEKVFVAHKRTLLEDRVLPPGLKLEDYAWIVAEWESTSSEISYPFCKLLQKLTCLKGFRDEDSFVTGADIQDSKILRRNRVNCTVLD
jgi:hypothetical protein